MDKFSDEEKRNIIKTVYIGRPKNEQDTFLLGMIERRDVQRHRPKNEESKQTQSSFHFFAMKGNNKIQVCRKAYISLHAISNKIVLRLTQLLNNAELPVDKREVMVISQENQKVFF